MTDDLSMRKLYLTNHLGLFQVIDVDRKKILDVFSTIEEALKDYPTAEYREVFV